MSLQAGARFVCSISLCDGSRHGSSERRCLHAVLNAPLVHFEAVAVLIPSSASVNLKLVASLDCDLEEVQKERAECTGEAEQEGLRAACPVPCRCRQLTCSDVTQHGHRGSYQMSL